MWAFSSSQYVHEAVKSVEEHIYKVGKKLMSKKPGTPIPTSYSPELNITPELISTDAAYYQLLVGILSWIVELGRVDICLEVSLMSSHLALPGEGHLDKLFHIFAYLKWYAPVVGNHGKLGPCPRPWRGGGTAHEITAICLV